MRKKHLLINFILFMTVIVTAFSHGMNTEASEDTEARWFPVSVSSLDDDLKVLVDFEFKYDKDGQLIQSPIKISNLIDQMANLNNYINYLYWIKDDPYSVKYFLYTVYGSDLGTYKYSYDEDGMMYEYPFTIEPDTLDLYSEYVSADLGDDEILENQLNFLEYKFGGENYSILERSDDYVTAATIYERFDEELWNKYIELKKIENKESIENIRYEFQHYLDGADTYIDKCTYYYNLYGNVEVWHGEDEYVCTIECDEHENSIFYDVQDNFSVPYYLGNGKTANYYNGYDEYGNLIYRVCYSDYVSTSYDSPLRDSALTDMFEFKTETTTRIIKQIDIYTYAYGDPAVYNSNPEDFEKSICDLSIADIVKTVGGDLDFIEGCRNEIDYMEE